MPRKKKIKQIDKKLGKLKLAKTKENKKRW